MEGLKSDSMNEKEKDLERYIRTLEEIKSEYRGLTIENIIKQLESRLGYVVKRREEVFRKPISECGFRVWTVNRLEKAGILTAGYLTKVRCKTDLLKIRLFGMRSLREVCEFMERNGLEFASYREEEEHG